MSTSPPISSCLFIVLLSFSFSLAWGQLDPNATYNGNATRYVPTGEGACSIPVSELPALFGAMNAVQDDNGAWCGAWVEVTGPGGTANIQIVDLCPECPSGSLDLNAAAFEEVTGSTVDGIFPITWRWISAPGNIGPIKFYSETSNPYFLKLQVINTVNPPVSMQVLHEGSWNNMTRQADHHFVFTGNTNPLAEPFSVRVTDIFSNQITTNGLTLTGTATGQSGSENFPAVRTGGIVVEQPINTEIADGGSQDFGFSVDGSGAPLMFTIRNGGSSPLNIITIAPTGPDASAFSVTSFPGGSIAPDATDSFEVTFAPASTGAKSALLTVTSDDPDSALANYEIHVTGIAVSSANDTDLDGLNDGAEVLMAALGFDWEVQQTDLVTTYFAGANTAGLFTTSQVQALHVDVPLLQRDTQTEKFTLTLGLGKSTTLNGFDPFPFSLPDLGVNGAGELEYKFSLGEDAAFLRVEVE